MINYMISWTIYIPNSIESFSCMIIVRSQGGGRYIFLVAVPTTWLTENISPWFVPPGQIDIILIISHITVTILCFVISSSISIRLFRSITG